MMKSLTALLEPLRSSDAPRPYALIDCAGLSKGEAGLPKELFDPLECLFTGDLAEELADVAPYLGRLRVTDDDQLPKLEELLISQVSMLVIPLSAPPGAEPTFADLHRHFRKFNVVYGPDAKPLFFRYYDARIIVDVLGVLETQQLREFFAQFEALIVHSPAKGFQTVRCPHGQLEIA